MTDEVERDPEDIDKKTGKPRCFGNNSAEDPVCHDCDFIDSCTVELISRMTA